MRYEILVVVKNRQPGHIILQEFVHLLAPIDHTGNNGQDKDGEKESGEELPDDVPVELFQIVSSGIKRYPTLSNVI